MLLYKLNIFFKLPSINYTPVSTDDSPSVEKKERKFKYRSANKNLLELVQLPLEETGEFVTEWWENNETEKHSRYKMFIECGKQIYYDVVYCYREETEEDIEMIHWIPSRLDYVEKKHQIVIKAYFVKKKK